MMSDNSITELDSMAAEFKRQIGHAKAIYQRKEEELGNRIKVLENELLLLQDKQPELLRGEKEWRETALIYEKRIEDAKAHRKKGNEIIEDYIGNIFLQELERVIFKYQLQPIEADILTGNFTKEEIAKIVEFRENQNKEFLKLATDIKEE